MKQAFATNLLRENGLQPFNDKKHREEQIGILVISEAEYNKPSHFVEPVRVSGGRLVKKKWIEDLHIENEWDDDKKYLDSECQDDDYEEGDGDDESDDDEPDDDESDVDESDDDEPPGYEYEDDEESEDEAYWKKAYKHESEDEESEDEAYWNKAYKGGWHETGNRKRYNDSRRLRSQALVYLAAPLT
ncbi:hypothetical protein FOPG_16534 [Fusarium oxysporum f. sp. conglutinans race 2 54008]|uniref:Uncharacterized protein n=1 Tax=Fusarium oxysporum f. sp. conglutinans race 2 54008 TaxID=1089457 RepID=X0GVE1_FUSOX|nr:hypothetical protein FOPG_16534 [Fusarium oxysporum f. sp. conglutinans race 2 54008]KAG6989714.1 hypothetical protein FocnCong_v020802 [Fusarium oxysporum f. sp. conglutinans]